LDETLGDLHPAAGGRRDDQSDVVEQRVADRSLTHRAPGETTRSDLAQSAGRGQRQPG
jgi:hypothetical protein